MFWRLDLTSNPCGMWKGKTLPWWALSKELASNCGAGSLLSLFHLKREEDPSPKHSWCWASEDGQCPIL